MLIPFTASLTMGSAPTQLSGTAFVNVRLAYLYDQDHFDKTGKHRHHLKVRLDCPATDPSKLVAVVTKVVFQGADPGFMANTAIQTLLQGWLNENLDDFDHIFGTVDLDRMAAKGQFQWMQPTDTGYAYSDLPAAAGGGMLAVLSMTENRSSAGLVLEVSPGAIPAGQRAGFLISKERLIEKLLMPTMAQVFPGSKASDFVLSSTGDSIVLAANASPDFKVTDTNGNSYTATLTDFKITMLGGEIIVDSHTKTTISPGVRALCHSTSYLGIKLATRADGQQALAYYNTRTAINEHSTETDPGIGITTIVLSILAVVIALVATVLTGGAAAVALVVVAGIGLGVAATDITIASEEYDKSGAGPEINSMVFDSRASIAWPDSQDFKLGSACLNQSLQLGGDPTFAH
jgi:hypothetical protein